MYSITNDGVSTANKLYGQYASKDVESSKCFDVAVDRDEVLMSKHSYLHAHAR